MIHSACLRTPFSRPDQALRSSGTWPLPELRRAWSGLRLLFILLTIAALAALPTEAEEWNRFRGPNGSGVSEATTVPVSWNEADFNWRIALPGVGHASPVTWGKRIFLVSGDEETGNRIASCLDSTSGRVLWTQTFEAATHRKHKLNSLASSTPAVDERALYLCWATPDEYVVTAISLDGEPLWRVDLGGHKGGHGFGVSPIISGELLIIANEQEGDSTIVALDRRTGDQRWKVDRDTRTAYSTPCVFESEGRSAELIFTNWKQGITAIDSTSGRKIWEISVFDQNHTETSIGAPVVADGLVFGTCGYLGYATHTVAVRPGRKSDGQGDEIFRVDRGAPLTTTPLVARGLLFLWADNGIVTCVDAKTGQEQWKKRVGGTYYASPVAVGNAVYCASTSGEMVALELSREYRELSRSPILEASHSSPAVSGGRMFVRTFSHLISIGGK